MSTCMSGQSCCVVSDETHRWTQAPNLNAASDKTVAVVSFTTPAGDPVAAYVNYAMHAINGYLVGITSADFPARHPATSNRPSTTRW